MHGESCAAGEVFISCLQGSAAAKGSVYLLLPLSCVLMLLLLGVREGGVNGAQGETGNVREERNVPSCLIIFNLPLIL